MVSAIAPDDTAAGTATGTAPGAEAGFTLIELLIVIAVVSVLAVGATLSIAAPGASAQSDAQLLQARYATLREAAILGGLPTGLRLEQDGLSIARLRDDGRGWDLGRSQPWRGSARLTLANRDLGAATDAPNILILPGAQSTPFAIRFARGDRIVQCRTDGWTGLTCDGA